MSHDPAKGFKIDTLQPGEAILDMDAIFTPVKPLRVDSSDKALMHLKTLHTVANDFFRHPDVFTDYAFSSWKGEAIE